jgi:hypothetical protein
VLDLAELVQQAMQEADARSEAEHRHVAAQEVE